MIAGNLELVKLLVKRKADVASKNKNGKTAADLARNLAIKEVLNEAVLAFKSQEDAIQSEANSAEPAALADADVQKLSDINAQGTAEIGPQERPQDNGATAAPLDQQPTIEQTSAGRRRKLDSQVFNETSDPETCRPSKTQKVALSFAEDDDTNEV